MLIWADPFLDLAGKGIMAVSLGLQEGGGGGGGGLIQSLDVCELTNT